MSSVLKSRVFVLGGLRLGLKEAEGVGTWAPYRLPNSGDGRHPPSGLGRMHTESALWTLLVMGYWHGRTKHKCLK